MPQNDQSSRSEDILKSKRVLLVKLLCGRDAAADTLLAGDPEIAEGMFRDLIVQIAEQLSEDEALRVFGVLSHLDCFKDHLEREIRGAIRCLSAAGQLPDGVVAKFCDHGID